MNKFTAVIHKIGINPVVDPPEAVLITIFDQAGRTNGPIPVRGSINGSKFVQTLVRYKGAWRLYVNGQMLKSCGLTVGDTADIQIEFDPQPREVPVPAKLAAALRKDKTASAAFAKLTPYRRTEILKYIGSLKTEAAIEKNVARVLTRLAGD